MNSFVDISSYYNKFTIILPKILINETSLEQFDLIQIQKKGISPEMLEKQLENFRNGFPYIKLLRPAIQGDGIICFDDLQKKEFIHIYEEQAPTLRVIKFVPASGAASRMFQHLFEFRKQLASGSGIPRNFNSDTDFNSVNNFLMNIHKFPFYNDLHDLILKEGKKADSLTEKDYHNILDYLLGEEGLNYSNLPKALLAFHNYQESPRTALEEHLVEALHYTKDNHSVARIHFTLSPEHINKFEEKIREVKEKYESQFHGRLEIGYSIQKSSTDIIAVDEHNEPFRNSDGTLHFRPAGHGALLSNLNDLDADIIFIKNIDNIVPDKHKAPTYESKKLIGGYLLFIRLKIYHFLKKAETGDITESEINEIVSFVVKQKLIFLPEDFKKFNITQKSKILAQKLNRPIRVCGMVRNVGEPGGGPFWVSDKDGGASLQIIESSQVDMKDLTQATIFRSATHFNPVDLVCCTIDYKGKPFNLTDFIDRSTGFISMKSSGGRTLKAQELPGLWNGSMAGWITLFVELPLITFNPVKTINDLLRDEHQ
jgi:hypothetical protein